MENKGFERKKRKRRKKGKEINESNDIDDRTTIKEMKKESKLRYKIKER